MKKKYFLIIVFGLLFSGILSVQATVSSSSDSGYEPVIYDNTIEFEAFLNSQGKVEAKWSRYDKTTPFTFYKLVKSSSNSNPVYPDQSYIFYSSNIDDLSYLDTNVSLGTNYYRICQIAQTKRYCSEKVVTITKTSSTNDQSNVSSEIKLTGSVSNNIINLSWAVSNDDLSSKSFKILWSKNQNPTYPLRESDNYYYLTSGAMNYKISNLADGKYYVRVCLYNNGCTAYSNELSFEINNSSSISCLDVYSPVCGSNKKTYGNSCYANKEGVTEYTEGKCAEVKPVTDNQLKAGPITIDKPLSEMNRDELIRVLIQILLALINK
ncbi:MAG: Kazal-type serine protease inhibitor [Candidatus Paceibacterota bacterium]|jgi:hypothetical protein